jgi:hypothetical protein
MTCQLEYHGSVRRRIKPTVAVFGLLLLPAFLVSTSPAQINGVPASVTSPGFGGRAINGVPASVTSLGPNGFTPRFNQSMFNQGMGVQFFANVPREHGRDFDGGRHRHRRDQDFFPFYGGYGYAYAVPYSEDSDAYAEDNSEYQGGPTIFDRRGRGAESYIPPVRDAAPAHREQPSAAASEPPAPEPPQPPTLLVFKDGHELEVGNYAIVGQTLFDLTPGHARRVALTDLDLGATQKKNEDYGVSFQVPPVG